MRVTSASQDGLRMFPSVTHSLNKRLLSCSSRSSSRSRLLRAELIRVPTPTLLLVWGVAKMPRSQRGFEGRIGVCQVDKRERGVAVGRKNHAKAGVVGDTGSREIGAVGIKEVKEGEDAERLGGSVG